MKIIICDLDGTLYPKKNLSNKNQLQDNIRAVRKWKDAGNEFVVATARGMHHYEELVEKLGFKPNFIGSNGAEVIYTSGEVVLKQMPIQIYIDLCRFIEDNDYNASVATGLNDEWVWNTKDKYPIKDAEIYIPSWDYIKLCDKDIINSEDKIERIQIFVPKEIRDELKDEILKLGYPVSITCSDDDLVDIGPLNCSKGISIEEICHKYNISKKDIIAMGDSHNDISMFKLADRSYCIDHAEEEVKRNANYIVSSVAEAIDKELS